MSEVTLSALNAYGTLIAGFAEQEIAKGQEAHLYEMLAELKSLLQKALGTPEIDSKPMELTDEDPQKLLRTIDETRLRMIAVLLGAGLMKQLEGAVPSIEAESVGPLVTLKSGLTYGFMENNCVILLPNLSNIHNPAYVASDLLIVYESARTSGDWVIDCSAIKALPLALVANLIGYRETLSRELKQVRLVWLPISAVPPESAQRIRRAFDLQELGDFLFTFKNGLLADKL